MPPFRVENCSPIQRFTVGEAKSLNCRPERRSARGLGSEATIEGNVALPNGRWRPTLDPDHFLETRKSLKVIPVLRFASV